MIVKAYSVHDFKSLTYSPPFYAAQDGAAVRIISDAARDPNSQLGRHPRDFVLYCVGSYDDASGVFTPIAPLKHVIDVASVVQDHAPAVMPLFDSGVKANG